MKIREKDLSIMVFSIWPLLSNDITIQGIVLIFGAMGQLTFYHPNTPEKKCAPPAAARKVSQVTLTCTPRAQCKGQRQ